MPTPHNSANKGDIAKTVLMPGDPLRAEFIANTFLKDAKCFNHVRGMLGFTGYYDGKLVSVMGSGMGMPSIGIYSYELFKFFDVDNIIRIGTAGTFNPNLELFDVCVAEKAYSESTFARCAAGITDSYMYPSESLNAKIKQSAEELGIKVHPAIVHSSDVFYYNLEGKAKEEREKMLREVKPDVVEMESFALFTNARTLNKNAACILTVSDSLVKHTETTAEERQKSFTTMMKLDLRTATR